jgi:hypothetical protein
MLGLLEGIVSRHALNYQPNFTPRKSQNAQQQQQPEREER